MVNTEEDAQAIRALEDVRDGPGLDRRRVTVISEPASWRGTGGLIGDVAGDISDEDIVVAIEAHCLPPRSLGPLLQALDGQVDALVGAATDDEPAGIYVLTRTQMMSRPASMC